MINQVTLVGRLTKDPDLRVTPEGTPVVNVTLAVNRQFKNHNGEYETDFVHCTLWRKTAENTANYCRKGSVIGITGKIQTRNYTNQEGKKVYLTEVVAETVQFLSRNTNDERSSAGGPSGNASSAFQTERRNSGDWPISGERTGSMDWPPPNYSNRQDSNSTVNQATENQVPEENTNATAAGIR
ncbi:single-stranded DNA-binding protein [Neobacillus sp. D3-1R]|uniref:single-stranded DNA-binding protein n=1 Tax=Neobacillus sp. D3-1R TaxID=3445778 RepID=UPI003F9FD8BA